jgi:hypothetical protein
VGRVGIQEMGRKEKKKESRGSNLISTSTNKKHTRGYKDK